MCNGICPERQVQSSVGWNVNVRDMTGVLVFKRGTMIQRYPLCSVLSVGMKTSKQCQQNTFRGTNHQHVQILILPTRHSLAYTIVVVPEDQLSCFVYSTLAKAQNLTATARSTCRPKPLHGEVFCDIQDVFSRFAVSQTLGRTHTAVALL